MAFLDLSGLNYFYTKLKSKFALASHTHNYAGSSSAGGSATSAVKLTTSAGSATQPVYFSSGKPVKTTYTLGKSVPSDAVFTDTTYSAATTSANGLMSTSDKSKLNGVATGATKNTLTTKTVTLTASGWSSNSQKVTVSGVTTSSIVIVSVADNNYGISCTAQASDSLTFTCETTPTADITVNVAILV